MFRPSRIVVTVFAVLVGVGCWKNNVHTDEWMAMPPRVATSSVDFFEEDPTCDEEEYREVGYVRIDPEMTSWPSAKPTVEKKVRELGGDAVVKWQPRTRGDQEVRSTAVGGEGRVSERTRVKDNVSYGGIVIRYDEDSACRDEE